MLCRDAMERELVTCRVSDSVRWCAGLMKDWNIGFMPVLGKDGRLAGVVTDRDLVVRVIAEGKPLATEVGAVMSLDVVTCGLDEDIRVAEEKMSAQRKSRIAVVDESGGCAGVISLSDIASLEPLRRTGKVLREVVRREATPRAEAPVLAGYE